MNKHLKQQAAPEWQGPDVPRTSVSVIVACRNEERFIGGCLESIVATDYPRNLLEVLVVDGMSEDATRSIVSSYSRRFPFVRLVENPRGIASTAFNVGIRMASGDAIMIMGAHNEYSTDYIPKSVEALHRYGADNVGGVIRVIPRDSGLLAGALVRALSQRFGVGNSHFRCENSEPRWVDTVFGGCYRKEVFENVGLFNDGLVYNQDIEFNRRLRRAGGRILLVPDIVSYYYARSDLSAFWRHSFRDGFWVVLSFLHAEGMPASLRHLVPMIFVAALFGSGLLSLRISFFTGVLLAVAGSYLAASLAASAAIARRERDIRCLLVMPLAFAALHFAYGFGSLAALGKTVFSTSGWRRLSRRLFRPSLRLEQEPQ
jgi:GT2 family glycosyltransferase